MNYSEIKSQAAYEAAIKLAAGCYQRNLLSGIESISGSTLRGKAGQYRSRYMASAANLLARCRANGIKISEKRGAHGARILVIGE